MAGYDLIQTDAQLAHTIEGLRDARVKRLAIDVEGENNLHRYGIHVALIQLFDGARGYIVDPLSLQDTNTLKPLLPIDVFRHYRTLFEELVNEPEMPLAKVAS